MTFDSQMVIPIAESTVKNAIPIGNNAAIIVPKTINKMIRDNGPETSSAVIKSSWILLSKITSIATPPVRQVSKSSSSISTSSQFSAYNSLASERSKFMVTTFKAQKPSPSS